MAEIISGQDALDALENGGNNGGSGKSKELDFTKFNVGSKYTVKVTGTKDFFVAYTYGIYEKVNSFVAKNPSKKTGKGFPVENLTCWDKAFLYHKDRSEEFMDDESKEAYKYKPELRVAMGFFDLDSGERIVIDVSKKQANVLRAAIKEFEEDLEDTAFKVSKTNGGTVSLTPVLNMKKLTETQRENFDNAPEEFKIEDFHDIFYEADDEEMLQLLVKAEFDVSLIGLEKPEAKAESSDDSSDGETSEATTIDDPSKLF